VKRRRQIATGLVGCVLTALYATTAALNPELATAIGIGYLLVIVSLYVLWQVFDA
jgi:hypothetical protein